MAELEIQLTEMFRDDAVVVHIDDEEVYAKEDVKTNLSVGIADVIRASVPSGTVNVTIAMPKRRLSHRSQISVENTLYLRVSVSQAGIVVDSTHDMPEYF